jgi:hypothetical protein
MVTQRSGKKIDSYGRFWRLVSSIHRGVLGPIFAALAEGGAGNSRFVVARKMLSRAANPIGGALANSGSSDPCELGCSELLPSAARTRSEPDGCEDVSE